MVISFSTVGPIERKTRNVATLCVGLVVALSGLTLWSYLSTVKTTVVYDGRWITAYIAVLAVLLGCFAHLLSPTRIRVSDITTLKKIAHVLAGILGFGTLVGFAVFSGVPVMLHQLTGIDGSIVVTVSGKETLSDRRKCDPRLLIDEFTFFLDNYLCPSDRQFRAIAIGDRIEVTGKVSSFGVTPAKVTWLDNEKNR